MKKNIAVVAGGSSSEYVISMKSAGLIMDCIDPERFNAYLVVIEKDQWFVQHEDRAFPINRQNFSWERKGQTVQFDKVYNIIHGTPGEDGKIQGYFDLIGMPYTGCDVITKVYCDNLTSLIVRLFVVGWGGD